MASVPNKQRERPPISAPVAGQFPCTNFVQGGGVAIFHLATARVVLCYHTRERYWFLPKGRRDVHESCEQGAEREGFEESGYRNRLLPLALWHCQPQPRVPQNERERALSAEPVWCQIQPVTSSRQYILYWYVAETLPPAVEDELNQQAQEAGKSPAEMPYQYPPKFPLDLTLRERLAMEPQGYQPVHHEGTFADEDEALYRSELVDVETARDRLGRSSVSADVVRIGWNAIEQRMTSEGLP